MPLSLRVTCRQRPKVGELNRCAAKVARSPTSMTAAETVLPARRPDLVFKPIGDDGQHVVKDPRTGAYFKLGLEESFLFARLDGRHNVQEVCRAFSPRFAEPLEPQDLE